MHVIIYAKIQKIQSKKVNAIILHPSHIYLLDQQLQQLLPEETSGELSATATALKKGCGLGEFWGGEEVAGNLFKNKSFVNLQLSQNKFKNKNFKGNAHTW